MKHELRVELQEIVADKAPRSLGEAVDKVPTFGGSSDVELSADKVEKMVAKHYKVVKGSLKFNPEIRNFPTRGRVESFVGFNADDQEDSENGITGSVNIAIELYMNTVRVYSLIRIDG